MTPQPTTLIELYEQQRTDGEALLVEGVDGLSSCTSGGAWARAAQIAHVLEDHGVRPGDRIVLQVDKSTEALLVYLACVRAGAAIVPVNPAYTEAELVHLLGDAEPSLVIADPSLPAANAPATVLTLDTAGGGTLLGLATDAPTTAPPFVATPDSFAAMVYTSGTTGRPKGAIISHRNLTSNALALAAAWGFEPSDRLLHMLPIFHVHGLFVAVNVTIAGGGSLVLAPRFDVGVALEQLPRCTAMMGVPTFYTRLLGDDRFGAETCRNARLIISGSAPLLASTHDEFRERTGHVILERYGMTETSMLTSNPLVGGRKPGTVGPPIDGVSVRVVDPLTGEPVGVGEVGGIEVSGPNVFAGYWKRPDQTRTEFTVDGYFRTADVGTIDSDGYLTIVGREKDLIISGGLNVYPKEIEEAIDSQPGVLVSAVIGVPDPDFGEAVVAVVVAGPGETVDVVALRESLRPILAGYKVPKRIHVVDALPQNAMGKVEKERLRVMFS